MKTVVNTTDFSDCNTGDFSHYFSGTIMVWDMNETKKRAFLVGEPVSEGGGRIVIKGQYLTKLREWKEKTLSYKNWNTALKPIAIRDMWFQCGAGTVVLSPNLHKNMKKSIRWNYGGIKTFGAIDAIDVASQGLTYWAFRDLYDKDVPTPRPFGAILTMPNQNLTSEVDVNGFMAVQPTSAKQKVGVFYRGRTAGLYDPATKVLELGATSAVWADYILDVGGLRKYGISIRGKS